ncbi:hypothetical protein MAPG_06910 [Magnaporthiopsis poae ATCC 64411]|uniref:Uncharacterized protein n=1 Tax=Magnaporthiopsis poae (strain ATCC 64411 / 73-15) TaxID=644358 RepID=A0A0C4E3B3_MAGP6|nr:hypothetical protein MAPG_06910 [Magnaporthiopsis poae ATCC 64411]
MDSSSCTETIPSAEEKSIPNGFDIDAAAIPKEETEFMEPEKLTPLLQEHESGIAVAAALGLVILFRFWLAYLLPIPGLRQALSLAAVAVLFLPLLPAHGSGSGNLMDGLPRYFYTNLTNSLTKLQDRTLPPEPKSVFRSCDGEEHRSLKVSIRNA